VLRAFPVLGRLLADVVSFWLDSSAEMLIRIHQDWRALAVTFGIPLTAPLETIHLGLGDHHRQGRTVASLVFSDGDHRWDIVYKPRDMRIDFEFQRLLKNEDILGGLPPMASLGVWHGEGYGYMEFVRHVPCRDAQERELFYTNAGRLSALLYVLGYTDGHRENLIASGPNLFFIDGETLLTPTLKADIHQHWVAGGKLELEDAFKASIARTELLPSWVFVGPQREAIDTSAFGAEPPQDRATSVPSWLNINTDLMVRGTVQTSALSLAHSPVAAGLANPFPRYQAHFKEGFRAHTGIVGVNGKIYSNRSDTGLWDDYWTVDKWKEHYAPCGSYAFAPPAQAV
jgi:lantibiotic modifying enzyme